MAEMPSQGLSGPVGPGPARWSAPEDGREPELLGAPEQVVPTEAPTSFPLGPLLPHPKAASFCN